MDVVVIHMNDYCMLIIHIMSDGCIRQHHSLSVGITICIVLSLSLCSAFIYSLCRLCALLPTSSIPSTHSSTQDESVSLSFYPHPSICAHLLFIS